MRQGQLGKQGGRPFTYERCDVCGGNQIHPTCGERECEVWAEEEREARARKDKFPRRKNS